MLARLPYDTLILEELGFPEYFGRQSATLSGMAVRDGELYATIPWSAGGTPTQPEGLYRVDPETTSLELVAEFPAEYEVWDVHYDPAGDRLLVLSNASYDGGPLGIFEFDFDTEALTLVQPWINDDPFSEASALQGLATGGGRNFILRPLYNALEVYDADTLEKTADLALPPALIEGGGWVLGGLTGLGTPPAPQLTGAYSGAWHSASGGFRGGYVELPIDLENGLVEPREQDAEEMSIRAVFDRRVTPDSVQVTVTPNPGATLSLAPGATGNELLLTMDRTMPMGRYAFTFTGATGDEQSFAICYVQGDVNCSGNTTGLDLSAIQHPSGWNRDLSQGAPPRCDVNRDGQVTAFDLALTHAPAYWNQPVPGPACRCP
jgi:hypothetical protein